jgi:hypothetical protein
LLDSNVNWRQAAGMTNAANEDWDLLCTYFPARWAALAEETQALKGLRRDKSAAHLLRVLLLHVGCGCSLRETVARARQAGLAGLSDVALLKRLRKSKAWLQALCRELWVRPPDTPQFRLVDSTIVKEPGPTGSQWRLHYSLQWPALQCDYCKLTAASGADTGESLRQYPLRAGEHVLADRGYSRNQDAHYAAARGALTTVRLNPHSVRLENLRGRPFGLLDRLAAVSKPGMVREWPVALPLDGATPVRARLCVIRKSLAAEAAALKKLRRLASQKQRTLAPETFCYARYVMVLTTTALPAAQVLECYRFRWQVELVFKRFKQLIQLGHVPKHDDDSTQAWLYGKLFVALLTEKLLAHARDFSPWGYPLVPVA